MRYNVLISKTARRTLENLQEKDKQRIIFKLKGLTNNPGKRRTKMDIKKLRDTDPTLYRLRVGDFRVIYAIIGDEVKVTEIMHRGKNYRGY
ncbi:type II toxin-antitoxin system RelE/ParE family toxin [Methanosarcinales archaeon]|nr:MAG: type II toxin-antitoxin system RelE/ParE family toxin [Methanosarcinales archaeon]